MSRVSNYADERFRARTPPQHTQALIMWRIARRRNGGTER